MFGDTADYMNALRESLTKIRRSSKGHIWLAGDFNFPSVNWDQLTVDPGGSYANLSRQMLDIANDFGLEQIVREPTRINNTLDLFFTTNPTLVEKSCVVPGISDHDGIPVIIMSTRPNYIKFKPRKVFLYSKADVTGLKKYLKDWSISFISKICPQTTVNTMYNDFKNAVEKAMEKFIPSKMVTKRNKCPWLNQKVKRLHKCKQRAYNSHRRLNTSDSYDNFKNIRKEVTTETRKIYRNHIKSVCSGSLKKFYSYIKSLKIDTIGIPTLKKDGRLHSDNQTKAGILNEQFSSVFTHENTQLTPEPESNVPSIQDIIIFEEGVTKLLQDLDPNKATGPDEIPARILKLAAEELAPALTHIFQHSLNSGELPDSWLTANITPLFKKGERTEASN
jgi:hypothetical protein